MHQRVLSKRLLFALAGAIVVAGCSGDPEAGAPEPERDVFQALEARPLDLPSIDLPGPSIRAGIAGRCLSTEETEVGAIGLPRIPGEAVLGPGNTLAELQRGPVYAGLYAGAPRIVHLSLQREIGGSRWTAVKTIWVSRAPYDGPVLIRGGRIEAPGDLGFGNSARPREALRLPSGSWPAGGTDPRGRKQPPRPGWRVTSVPTRIRAPGCYAFQVDGEGFSYVLSFGVQAE
jgi:hypothetical protein